MLDFVKKGMMVGMGLMSMTEKEIRKAAALASKKGSIAKKDIERMANEYAKLARAYRQRFEKMAKEQANLHLARMDRKSRAELLALKRKMVGLEKELEKKAIAAARHAALKFLEATDPKKGAKKGSRFIKGI